MYKYSEEQCDVKDKVNLAYFRSKKSEWQNILEGQDRHSIWNQLPELLWNDTVFRIVNEARRIAEKNPHPDVGFNGAVSRLFDVGFITSQTTAIRRLTERWPNPNATNVDQNRAVFSLWRVLHETEADLEKITREVYVSYDGLPYDPEPLKRAWLEKKIRENDFDAESMETEGPNAWGTSQRIHSNFDKLSGIDPSNRSRNDLIKPSILAALKQKLDECEDVCKFVDKHIAHAADPANRSGLTIEQRGVSLAQLSNCYKNIYQVAYYTTGQLIWAGSHGGLPVPQYDHLENLDKRWITSENLESLRDTWKQREGEVEAWASDPWVETL